MRDRIKRIADKTVRGEIYIEHTDTDYDRKDLFLPPVTMDAKRIKEYVLNQTPYICEDMAFTGYLRWRGNVLGDFFQRCGHQHFQDAVKNFYRTVIDGTFNFDWQHSVIDFEKVLRIGILGYKEEIRQAGERHTDKDSVLFLDALDTVADAIIEWCNKCSRAAYAAYEKSTETEARERLFRLSETLKCVPANPARNFYEAVLTVYVMFAFNQDALGTLDRYLYPFYKRDIDAGAIDEQTAKDYLQELFLMIQFRKKIDSEDLFTRGGESHICIGGYLPDGSDGWSDLSRLVLDSLVELPTWCPQLSFRWTEKTPSHVLKYVMECERADAHKRIAFVNDEPRIKAYMEIGGFPFETACRYTMVGCNEPSLPGAVFMGGIKTNAVKAMESTLYGRTEDICRAADFDGFYGVFEEELYKLIDLARETYDGYQRVRSRDINLVSSMFYEGSVEMAKSVTQGGAKNCICDLSFIGMTTVIDSLAIIKQFVFDEKAVSMRELICALEDNWEGHEALHAEIKKRGLFFGNDDATSEECANRYAGSIATYLKGKRSELGYPYMVGNLIGYVEHNKLFGDETRATPDGRRDGDVISFGIGQTDGKDRSGLPALLSAVAKLSKKPIFCGETVTNVLVDEQLVKNDANFEKLVRLFEGYFRMGGLHFQLTYVSKEDLKNAKTDPDKYKCLRVRVSGFSDYFVLLNGDLQDDIIRRTEKKK